MSDFSGASEIIPPAFPSIATEPGLRERVRDALEDMIITRALAPGTRLQEASLAAALNVSRNPVREALSVLARDGWVDLRPRQGACVHEPTDKEIRDFFDLRSALQSFAARRACEKATPEQIAELRAICRDGHAAIAREDYARGALQNSLFHEKIGLAADNVMLAQSLEVMKKRLLWYFSPVVQARGQDSWHEHERIVDAIESGDGELAASLMQAHTDATGAVYPYREPATVVPQ
jgi:DNA-binding GntR family transcriptional regulator